MRRLLMNGAASQLPEGYDVETHFGPSYGPWDQRLCVVPDGDLFAAIRNNTPYNEAFNVDQQITVMRIGVPVRLFTWARRAGSMPSRAMTKKIRLWP